MSDEKKDYPKTGFKIQYPSAKTPDWVKAVMGIKRDECIAYLNSLPINGEWLNFQILESQRGHLYIKFNDYKKDEEDKPKSRFQRTANSEPVQPVTDATIVDTEENLPF